MGKICKIINTILYSGDKFEFNLKLEHKGYGKVMLCTLLSSMGDQYSVLGVCFTRLMSVNQVKAFWLSAERTVNELYHSRGHCQCFWTTLMLTRVSHVMFVLEAFPNSNCFDGTWRHIVFCFISHTPTRPSGPPVMVMLSHHQSWFSKQTHLTDQW